MDQDDKQQQPDSTEDKQQQPDSKQEPEAPAWRYSRMKDWGINRRMVDVIKLTMKVAETEADMLRNKLNKLQYGG